MLIAISIMILAYMIMGERHYTPFGSCKKH